MKELVAVGADIWASSQAMESEPASGQKKHLEITYTKDGSTKSIRVDEGSMVDSPDFPSRDGSRPTVPAFGSADSLGTPAAIAHDREVAEWAHRVGGRAAVELGNGWNTWVVFGSFPDEPFRVVRLDLRTGKVDDAGAARLRGLDRLLSIDLTGANATDETLKILSELPNLEAVTLSWHKYTDEGLKLLGRLKKLIHLGLEGTRLTDATLAGFSDLENAEFLHFGRTFVRGPGLVHLAKMCKANTLLLDHAPIDDAGLAFLPDLQGLRILNLSDTKITDAGLKTLSRFPQLVQLHLSNTQVSGTGLAHLAVMTNLRRLGLSGTKLDDAGLANLPEFPRLWRLNLGATEIGDMGLEHLRGRTALRELDVRKTRVTARGLLRLHQALPDCKFLANVPVMMDYNESLRQLKHSGKEGPRNLSDPR